jgi:hypothetical protein
MHVHVQSSKGEAKFWIEAEIILAKNEGFSTKDLRIIENIIKGHEDEIRDAWHKHFPS